jgi:hypothetical protein
MGFSYNDGGFDRTSDQDASRTGAVKNGERLSIVGETSNIPTRDITERVEHWELSQKRDFAAHLVTSDGGPRTAMSTTSSSKVDSGLPVQSSRQSTETNSQGSESDELALMEIYDQTTGDSQDADVERVYSYTSPNTSGSEDISSRIGRNGA